MNEGAYRVNLRSGVRVQFEDSVEFLGPDVLVRHQVRDKAARVAQPLSDTEMRVRLPQFGLPYPQGLLCLLAYGDVLHDADEQRPTVRFVRLVTKGVYILHRPARWDDAEDLIEIGPLDERAPEIGFERRDVIGMEHGSNRLYRDLGAGIEFEDAIEFLGPSVLVSDQVRYVTAGPTQPLSFGEKLIGTLHFRVIRPRVGVSLSSLLYRQPLLNFGADAKPFNDPPRRVRNRRDPEEESTIHAIVSPQACFLLTGLTGLEEPLPPLTHAPQIFGVDGGLPTKANCLIQLEPRVIAPSSVDELSLAIRARYPDQPGQRIDDLTEVEIKLRHC